MTKQKKWWKKLWRNFWWNKQGQLIVAQFPNISLSGWLICRALEWASINNQWSDFFSKLGTGWLFVWAYLELFEGDNYFRRLLGLIVGGMIVLGWWEAS